MEPKDFYITGDLNVEWRFMCTDAKDIEELDEMSGPLCRQGYVKDPGGHKKLMWYVVMKEFIAKPHLRGPGVEGLKKRLSRTNIWDKRSKRRHRS